MGSNLGRIGQRHPSFQPGFLFQRHSPPTFLFPSHFPFIHFSSFFFFFLFQEALKMSQSLKVRRKASSYMIMRMMRLCPRTDGGGSWNSVRTPSKLCWGPPHGTPTGSHHILTWVDIKRQNGLLLRAHKVSRPPAVTYILLGLLQGSIAPRHCPQPKDCHGRVWSGLTKLD